MIEDKLNFRARKINYSISHTISQASQYKNKYNQ